MKKHLKNITAIFACILLASCSDYLDLPPEDKYLEETVFSTDASVYTALNGIYDNMTKKTSYGEYLTLSVIDVLAQRYRAPSSSYSWYTIATYDYKETKNLEIFEDIWETSYINILNINNFITALETYKVTFLGGNTNQLIGEALGLRAMHHLDLLRLYGPVYSENPSGLAIPYNVEAKPELSPILPANEVMVNILADLKKAEELLSDDSVRTEGTNYLDFSVNDFSSEDNINSIFRNLRMNYFAVKALQARANLYAGNTVEALKAAKIVIDEASAFFPWTDPQAVISAGASPDRLFSPEVIFGLQNFSIYNSNNQLFNSSLTDFNILAPHANRLNVVFENNANDYRFNSSWILPTIGGKRYKTFFKYTSVEDSGADFRFLQPLIRITEMYYIAAETETDPTAAISYLNTARFNRGLVALDATVDIESEILKEYEREFYGEGQLFFYYKRKNMQSIPNGANTRGFLSMDATKYVVPLPLSEVDFR